MALTLARDEHPHALAALRVVVPALILISPGLREGVRVAALDRALWVVPEGLHGFVALAPISPSLAIVVEVLTVFAALLAIAGLRARIALGVMTVGAFYLCSLAQLTGFVWHDMHLLWLAALLAASPCDHAWAVDAKVASPPSRAYGVPLQIARAILGCVYVFPGLHKVWAQGLGWAVSDNLRNQLYWKWAEYGDIPAIRLDQHPTLLAIGGLGVLLFELSAPVLFLVPRTRLVGAIAGVAFHLSAQAVFRIPFFALWACYVVLVDVRAIGERLGLVREETLARASRGWPTLAVGGLILLGVVVQGVRGQTQSYPFACYPTFEHYAGTSIPDLRILVVRDDGTSYELVHARDAEGKRTQRQWGTVFALAGVTAPVDGDRLRAYYTIFAHHGEPLPREVRFLRVYRSVLPDEKNDSPRSEEEIFRFQPATP